MVLPTVGQQTHNSEVVMIEPVHISINGVEAGSISAEQYHALRRQPLRDRNVWLLQARVLLSAAVKLAGNVLLTLPAFFLAGLAMLAWDQAVLVQVIRSLQAATPEQIASDISTLLYWGAVVYGYSSALACVLKPIRKYLGLRDCFAEESDRLIRVAIGATAVGPMKAYEYSANGKMRPV